MSETYQITAPNSVFLNVDKKTNEIIFEPREKETGKYTKQYSKALLQAWQIMQNSPYKDYKEVILDPKLYTGQSSTLLEFKAWQKLYLNDPVKGAIAPWTKKEKAYYESLKTKKERYKYLVIRSGLRASVIDIPDEAIGAYLDRDEFKKDKQSYEKDENMYEKYEDLIYIVMRNANNVIGVTPLIEQEWGIAAGILGMPKYLDVETGHGFKARSIQSYFLYLQLSGGGEKELDRMRGLWAYADKDVRFGLNGIHKNKVREMELKELSYTLKSDEFGMLPYLDELIGVDWVMDFNMLYNYAVDDGNAINSLYNQVKQGELKDPRDKDSTPESRMEFHKKSRIVLANNLDHYNLDLPNDWSEKEVELYIDSLILEAKIMSLTPPQGYPNAPLYYVPEYFEDIYKNEQLDKKLKPTIPAIQREHFPEYLRKEIEHYAKEHNVKD